MDRPILSIRTSGPVATAIEPIINPKNLKIEGWLCQDSVEKKKQLILLVQELRDILPQGLVVNDHEVLAEPHELIRMQDLLEMHFVLIGKPVEGVSKAKIGKVTDFAVDSSTLYVQKLYVGQSLLKSLAGGNLIVDRNQIVEISNKKIIIQDPLQPTLAEAPAAVPTS